MTKIKLLLTIIYVLFTYSCTEHTIYSGKIINQANIDYSIIKNKNQMINELGKPSYIDPIEDKWRSFGWKVESVDGHNISEIVNYFDKLNFKKQNLFYCLNRVEKIMKVIGIW